MKKHVFVVTWFASENYGTCLQAYATKTVLEEYAQVKFLDRRTYYSIMKTNYLIPKLKSAIMRKLNFKPSNSIYETYEDAHKRRVDKVSKLAGQNYDIVSINSKKSLQEIDDWADCYLVGSDQMWNPWMLSPAYLLDFVPNDSTKPKYSYATSFGVDNIPNGKKKIYQKYLPLFSQISVREHRAAELVKELGGKDVKVDLDPTFLLRQKDWRTFASQSDSCEQYGLNEDYVLCYFIGAPEFDHLATAKIIAEKIGAKVVLLPTKEKDYQSNDQDVIVLADACAYDFVSLVDHARLVCTDSFHAVVFSFLMETAFFDFPRFKKGDKYSQEARLKNIMEKFSLMDSFWSEEMLCSNIQSHIDCDYTQGYEVLENERAKCTNLLKKMIEG